MLLKKRGRPNCPVDRQGLTWDLGDVTPARISEISPISESRASA